jgi:hypothetical protein
VFLHHKKGKVHIKAVNEMGKNGMLNIQDKKVKLPL